MAPQSALPLLAALLLLVGAAANGEAGGGAAGPAPAAMRELPQPDEALVKQQNPHQAVMDYADKFVREQAERPPRSQEDLAPDSAAGGLSLLEALLGGRQADSCGIDERELPVKRQYLVVLPVGDDWDASKWLREPEKSNWDLVAIYYGSAPELFRCPLCAAVYAASGPKWRLAWRFTLLPEWPEMTQKYKAVLWPDDDLVMDTCTVNKLFSVLTAYDLIMAQPSLCEATWSHSPYKMVYQQKDSILRFTTFVEIMAPAFEMSFFDNFIRPSLHNAYVGWGLDFVWPFLLRYPRDRIAVIDEVCIYHPPSTQQKSNSVYAADAPFRQKEEEARRFAEYEYFDSAIAARGFWYQVAEVLGVVPRPTPQEGILETTSRSLQARLGPYFPLLLMGQFCIIILGCCGVACMQLRSRRAARFISRTSSPAKPLLAGMA